MAYQTLYRKWRPARFDDLVGQGHITSTLKNEIINNKIAHAYMFTGTRGTGKTSTAKILSRAINCENPQDGNPCNECPSCLGILNETILDVVEMDAASNTGVDSIREIIDQVRYSTAGTRYKVYIIDEVHMLSMGAFNALLKTLEEPPAHVVFILATTEIHKIPATILSRCQRFDFKNIGTMDIADAVGNIFTKENISITRDAVEYIAYLGNGSMRDALSIAEQCLAYKPDNITYSDVTEILGTLDDEFLYVTAGHIAKGDVRALLELFGQSMQKGKNPSAFAEGMLKAVRDILLFKLSPELCDFNSGKRALVEKTAPAFTKEKLLRCIDVIASALKDIKNSANASVIVEATFIRLASPEYECDVNSLLDRISTLENRIANMSFEPKSTPRTPAASAPRDNESRQTPSAEPVVPPVPKAPEPEDKPQYDGKSASALSDVVFGWASVSEGLQESGRLLTFVSLYGVKPRAEGNTLILAFDSKDAASKFSSSDGVADVKQIISELFSLTPDIKCTWEQPGAENESPREDIFSKVAQITSQ